MFSIKIKNVLEIVYWKFCRFEFYLTNVKIVYDIVELFVTLQKKQELGPLIHGEHLTEIFRGHYNRLGQVYKTELLPVLHSLD